ncbi:MAG TPA: hypothetical protein VL860_01430 [Planctomycetota bacterium]|nr:hypothetical protein [Planctomycetota bacterium]
MTVVMPRDDNPAPTYVPKIMRHASFYGWIGVARQDITPPVGIYARNWGAAKHDVAEGIHRPMTLTVLTLQEAQDAPPLVLIAADLCWWREAATERSVREPILAALKLDPARLIFNLSHTHSGPAISPAFAELPGGDKIAGYLDLVRTAAVKTAKTALANAVPATLDWTRGRCDLACNRDLPDPTGKTSPYAAPNDGTAVFLGRRRIVCGYNPAEPADDTVLVGRVIADRVGGPPSPRHNILATLVNYACHPVTLAWENRLISPDYVGAMREVIEKDTAAPCLFLQGASGELAPALEYVGNPQVADTHGRRLGHAALSALEGMLPPLCESYFEQVVESGAPLATWNIRPRFRFNLDAGKVPACKLQAMRASTDYLIKEEYPPAAEIELQLADAIRRGERVLGERLRRKLAVRQSMGDGTHVTSHQWLWQVGEALVAGVPNEAYSQLQMELRKQLAPHEVVVMNLVNGSTAYLPPAALYSQDVYQVWQTPYDRGCLEQTISACSEGLRKLVATETPVTKP